VQTSRPSPPPTPLHSPILRFGLVASVALAAVAAGVTGCGRTGLDLPDELALAGDVEQDAGVDALPDAPPDAFEAAAAHEAAAPPAMTTSIDPCADKPPVPCPGGGFEYCVAGHYSECPKRCAACVPGSTRVCFITYCKSWGVQTCASDGLSFGVCEESSPPAQCGSTADSDKASPALEQCCIDSGNCCQDLYDLNGNGDTSDQVGNCTGTTC
jgi:hypothetical protein